MIPPLYCTLPVIISICHHVNTYIMLTFVRFWSNCKSLLLLLFYYYYYYYFIIYYIYFKCDKSISTYLLIIIYDYDECAVCNDVSYFYCFATGLLYNSNLCNYFVLSLITILFILLLIIISICHRVNTYTMSTFVFGETVNSYYYYYY